MYKFLVFLLITIALLVFFIETKNSGLIKSPTNIHFTESGLIRIWYGSYVWTF